MDFDGGYVSDVVISNLTIDCTRHDWFWWGDGEPFHFNVKKRSEVHRNWKKEDDRPAGSIRNILIQNVIARGQGSSICNGHPERWLDGITLDNVKLYLSHNPAAPYDKSVHALIFRRVRNLRLRNLEIFWDKPGYGQWRSALYLEDISGLELERLEAGPAEPAGEEPALVLNQVENARISGSKAQPGTVVFCEIKGERSRSISLFGNDFQQAKVPYRLGPGVAPDAVRAQDNLTATQ
jgi:hypothetical protein